MPSWDVDWRLRRPRGEGTADGEADGEGSGRWRWNASLPRWNPSWRWRRPREEGTVDGEEEVVPASVKAAYSVPPSADADVSGKGFSWGWNPRLPRWDWSLGRGGDVGGLADALDVDEDADNNLPMQHYMVPGKKRKLKGRLGRSRFARSWSARWKRPRVEGDVDGGAKGRWNWSLPTWEGGWRWRRGEDGEAEEESVVAASTKASYTCPPEENGASARARWNYSLPLWNASWRSEGSADGEKKGDWKWSASLPRWDGSLRWKRRRGEGDAEGEAPGASYMVPGERRSFRERMGVPPLNVDWKWRRPAEEGSAEGLEGSGEERRRWGWDLNLPRWDVRHAQVGGLDGSTEGTAPPATAQFMVPGQRASMRERLDASLPSLDWNWRWRRGEKEPGEVEDEVTASSAGAAFASPPGEEGRGRWGWNLRLPRWEADWSLKQAQVGGADEGPEYEEEEEENDEDLSPKAQFIIPGDRPSFRERVRAGMPSWDVDWRLRGPRGEGSVDGADGEGSGRWSWNASLPKWDGSWRWRRPRAGSADGADIGAEATRAKYLVPGERRSFRERFSAGMPSWDVDWRLRRPRGEETADGEADGEGSGRWRWNASLPRWDGSWRWRRPRGEGSADGADVEAEEAARSKYLVPGERRSLRERFSAGMPSWDVDWRWRRREKEDMEVQGGADGEEEVVPASVKAAYASPPGEGEEGGRGRWRWNASLPRWDGSWRWRRPRGEGTADGVDDEADEQDKAGWRWNASLPRWDMDWRLGGRRRPRGNAEMGGGAEGDEDAAIQHYMVPGVRRSMRERLAAGVPSWDVDWRWRREVRSEGGSVDGDVDEGGRRRWGWDLGLPRWEPTGSLKRRARVDGQEGEGEEGDVDIQHYSVPGTRRSFRERMSQRVPMWDLDWRFGRSADAEEDEGIVADRAVSSFASPPASEVGEADGRWRWRWEPRLPKWDINWRGRRAGAEGEGEAGVEGQAEEEAGVQHYMVPGQRRSFRDRFGMMSWSFESERKQETEEAEDALVAEKVGASYTTPPSAEEEGERARWRWDPRLPSWSFKMDWLNREKQKDEAFEEGSLGSRSQTGSIRVPGMYLKSAGDAGEGLTESTDLRYGCNFDYEVFVKRKFNMYAIGSGDSNYYPAGTAAVSTTVTPGTYYEGGGGIGDDTAENENRMKQELSKTEEEILTLRQVLSAKTQQASDLKKKLGVSVWSEMKTDLKVGIQSIRESDTPCMTVK